MENKSTITKPQLPAYIGLRLFVPIADSMQYVFLQQDVKNRFSTDKIHSHLYSELHLFLGDVNFNIEGKVHTLSGSNLIFVPKNTYHSFTCDKAVLHCTFQTVLDSQVNIRKVSKEFLSEFFDKIASCTNAIGYASLIPYISFLFSYIFPYPEKNAVYAIDDFNYIIDEFFSLSYHQNTTSLTQLSKLLCVSPKQAHRIILKCTGNTFSQELTSRRMKAADRLVADGRLSLSEIAKAVGYETYAGFWKAYKKHLSTQSTKIESDG